MNEPTDSTRAGLPPDVGIDWCHWHAGPDDTTAPVKELERQSAGPYRLYACTPCRKLHQLTVITTAVQHCVRCDETVPATDENRIDSVESMSGVRPDRYAHRRCGAPSEGTNLRAPRQRSH